MREGIWRRWGPGRRVLSHWGLGGRVLSHWGPGGRVLSHCQSTPGAVRGPAVGGDAAPAALRGLVPGARRGDEAGARLAHGAGVRRLHQQPVAPARRRGASVACLLCARARPRALTGQRSGVRLGGSRLQATHSVVRMSTGPPCMVATTGAPCAAASMSVSPKGSCGVRKGGCGERRDDEIAGRRHSASRAALAPAARR